MNLIMYGLQAPNDYKLRSTLLNHKLYIKKKEFFLVPNKFDEGIINPETFFKTEGRNENQINSFNRQDGPRKKKTVYCKPC